VVRLNAVFAKHLIPVAGGVAAPLAFALIFKWAVTSFETLRLGYYLVLAVYLTSLAVVTIVQAVMTAYYRLRLAGLVRLNSVLNSAANSALVVAPVLAAGAAALTLTPFIGRPTPTAYKLFAISVAYASIPYMAAALAWFLMLPALTLAAITCPGGGLRARASCMFGAVRRFWVRSVGYVLLACLLGGWAATLVKLAVRAGPQPLRSYVLPTSITDWRLHELLLKYVPTYGDLIGTAAFMLVLTLLTSYGIARGVRGCGRA